MARGRYEKPEQLRHRLAHVKTSRTSYARLFTMRLQPPDYNHIRDREYVYRFKSSAPQRDPVIRLIRETILELNETPEHGLIMCNANIHVAPTTSAPPICTLNAQGTNDIKFYTFSQDKKEFPATVPVALIPPTRSLTAASLHVRSACSWVSLSTWLLDLADPKLLQDRGTESSTYFWRKRSKKPFRLLDLSAELRSMIFEFVLAPTGIVYPISQSCCVEYPLGTHYDHSLVQDIPKYHKMLGMGRKANSKFDFWADTGLQRLLNDKIETSGGIYHQQGSYEDNEAVPSPNLAIFRVSKQVTAEALKAGWERPLRSYLDYWLFFAVSKS
ncbi:hypothetical protein NX059_011441 [Plenodomus lindquistii]|nr:hypothetical protein NX059_011441 [Plenodomus lindquistii]